MNLLLVLTLFLLTLLSPTSAQTCYNGDGTIDPNAYPCPYSNNCCHTNPNDGYSDETCYAGVCGDYIHQQWLVVGCTAQNWDKAGSGCSPLWAACGRQSGFTYVTYCSDGAFCCGENNAVCCNEYAGFYLNKAGTEIVPTSGDIEHTASSYIVYSTGVPTSLETRFATTSRTSSASATSTATTPPSSEKPESGLSIEAKIGIGVGVPAVIIAALTLWVQCRKS